MADVIGSVGLILSLILLSFQIYQNTAVLKNQTNISLLEFSFEVRASMLEDDELITLKYKADQNYSSLTKEEKFKYGVYISRIFDIWEQALLAERAGLFDAETFSGWNASYSNMLSLHGPQSYWKENQMDFSEAFRAYINSYLSSRLE